MNWDAIGAIAEIFGALGVIATLAYLAIQIRQNTRSTRLASFQASTEALNAINLAVVGSAELSKLFGELLLENKYQTLDDLTTDDRIRLTFTLVTVFRSWEAAFFQRQEGLALADSWERYEISIRRQMANPVTVEWWHGEDFGFTSEFRNYIDGIAQQKGPGT